MLRSDNQLQIEAQHKERHLADCYETQNSDAGDTIS